jgi:hypothetical protein
MKIRMDFVTNSSSSSFIVSCSEILDKEALITYLKEEYGRKSEDIIKYHIVSGKDVKEECENITDYLYVSASDLEQVEDEKEYLFCYDDIEDCPSCSAGLTYDVGHESLKYLFSDSWSGFNG